MEEHRFTCPTHVREFTRFRGHFNPTLEAADPPVADEPRPTATAATQGDEERALAAAPAPSAR